jgi:hypothetical protein
MLHLVTKERFEEWCKGKQPTQKIDLVLEENIEWPYFEIPETDSWLLYVKELRIGLVFGTVPSDFTISYDDWKLEKIGEKPNTKYILNIMKACVYLNDDFYKVAGIGEWRITNTRFPYTTDFSIKICGDYYHSTAIGYEEKLKTPIDKAEIRIKDKLIEHVGNGLRGNNKEGSRGS